MTLLVVIVNYRVAELTLECLRALQVEARAIPGMRAVVVENASGDGSHARLQEGIASSGWDGWVELVALPENGGFARGVNVALRRALSGPDNPDYFLLLNPDAVVLPGAVSALLRLMSEEPRAGVAGSRMQFADGRPQGPPFRFQGIVSEFDRGLAAGPVSRLLRRWAVNMAPPGGNQVVDWIGGASMMIRRSVVESMGLLDEGYFLYFEDMDYCLGVTRAGWSVWYVPDSIVVHHEGSSSSGGQTGRRRPGYWFEARRRFFVKNYGPLYAAAADLAFVAGCALGCVYHFLRRRPSPCDAHQLSDTIRHSIVWTAFTS